MGAKTADWDYEVQSALTRLAKPALKFSFEQAAALVDYLAARKVVSRHELMERATQLNGGDADNFIKSTLANVTMAIHLKGSVPDPGGWYFHDAEKDVYVLDRGFSAAWREERS